MKGLYKNEKRKYYNLFFFGARNCHTYQYSPPDVGVIHKHLAMFPTTVRIFANIIDNIIKSQLLYLSLVHNFFITAT